MVTSKQTRVLLILIFTLCSICYASHNVDSVSFRGDSTLMGMKIEGVYDQNGAFLVVTTGARYEYVPGEMKIYQGLGSNKRLISTIKFDQNAVFERVSDNNDHALFWSKNFDIGIYGDSTCIISPKFELDMNCTGNFKPDYEGRYNGELLLIDDKGGMEIYPQRYEAGYEIKRIELEKKDWVADYALNANERVMIAAFPGRKFDWEKSFSSNVVATCGSMGLGENNPYGQMPSDFVINRWSKSFNIIVVFYSGLYKEVNPGGPYDIANEPEFTRLLRTAHATGMKITAYTSFFYYAYRYKDIKDFEGYFKQVKALRDNFGINGVYIDGCFVDGANNTHENKIASWEMMRRLRELFGKEGVLILHGTHKGNPTGTVPNIDTYCDVTVTGEGIPFKSFDDPYVLYCVKKYGISNTVGVWYRHQVPTYISDKDIIEAVLKMNCRELMGEFVVTREPPPKWSPHFGKYVWPTKLDPIYQYYLQKLREKQQEYYADKAK
jgi:hypothetical protein